MRSFQLHEQALTAFTIFCLFPSSLADTSPSPRQYCVYGCNQATSSIGFVDADPLDPYTTQCSNGLYLQSFSYCIRTYCDEKEAEAGLQFQADFCLTNLGLELPDLKIHLITQEELSAIQVANATISAGSLEEPLVYPVVIDEEAFSSVYRTVAAHFGNRAISFKFAWAMYGFWGFVVLIGVANRYVEWLAMRRRAVGDQHSSSKGFRLWLRKRLLLPATFGEHCQDPVGWCTIPPRLESVVLLLYLIMNFVFMFPGYDIFDGNVWYPTYTLQLSRYIGLRAGIITISQLPVIWVFATRNDPLLWITGWSFATYNRFHRWVARLCMAFAIVHAVCFTIYTIRSGPEYYVLSWSDEYFYCGAIGVVMISFLVGTSVYIFRVQWYEVFLVVHIVLSAVLIVVLYFHVTGLSQDAVGFLYTCIAVWALDRTLRFARVIYFGLVPRFAGTVTATAGFDEAANIVTIDVTGLLRSKEMLPGQFFYLYSPGNIRGYESHPFTLCSWRRPTSAHAQERSASPAEEGKQDHPPISQATPSATDIVHSFLIRPYSGFTSRLRNQLSSIPSDLSQLTVFLEGPYGKGSDLRAFSDVLIIAGGNGITSAISHSNFLLPAQKTSVHVVWAVQESGLVEHVCANELREAVNDENFDLTVYETRNSAKGIEHGTTQSERSSAAWEVKYGRPDIGATIRAVRENSLRNLAVVVCGPPRLADAVRAAVVDDLGESGPGVEFYNEAMSW